MFKTYHKIKENFVAHSTSGYTPLQLASFYNFPESDGTGQTIGIIELGAGYDMNDITTYLTNLGITKAPNIVDVSVDGVTNNPNDGSGADIEVVLDIEIIIALVPGANIRVYFASNTNQGFYNAIQQAINDNCNIISISWGAKESSWSPTDLTNFNSLFQTASEKGVTVFAAAGDNGASDGGRGLNVDFPGSSPYVVSCGGTSIQTNGNQIIQETVWNNNPTQSSTGGGISTVFSKPAYQNSIASLKSINFRCVPDISGNADPNTGYIIYINGQAGQVGGTSAVAPLWAAH